MQESAAPAIHQAASRAGRTSGWRRWLPAAALAVLFVVTVILAGVLARRQAAEDLAADARAGLPLALAALRGEIEKHRTIPLILSEDSAVVGLLRAPDAASLAATDEKLRLLALETRAAVIYLLDRDGLAIAASNYLEKTSFVGNDYRFRRYYEGAVAEGAAEQYALGTVSNRPGVYFSRRVGGAGGPLLGVVVVKVELDAVEKDWREAGRPVYVEDSRGVVVVTSVPDWRFRTLRPMGDEEAADIRESLQFGGASLSPMPLAAAGSVGDVGLIEADAGSGRRRFVAAASSVEGGLAGWRLHVLVPADRALLSAASLAQVVAGLSFGFLAACGITLSRRARRGRERLAERTEAAAVLERRVTERTRELTASNMRLTGAIAEREKAEARVLTLREDLIQANRLASLGQITAGVAHEINQPLAAIRTYAENAGRFLARNDAAAVGANLETVVGLADRIGAITETLRSFSRRATGPVETLPLDEPIEGAMLILDSRIRESGVAFERPPADPQVLVLGNKIRLEQVLVNLVRNALEALEGRREPRISMRVETAPDHVLVRVSDNGPGIPPDILPQIFTPFSTSKPKGLGLGLVISSDIVAEFGGALTVESRSGEGAHFTIRLKRAAG